MSSLSRRKLLGALTLAGTTVVGHKITDVCGDVTPDTPPYDTDEDGLFEDLNGDGRLTYEDVIMYLHEGVWEEATGEDFGHAFDYSQDGS